jgi:hypothetical protein
MLTRQRYAELFGGDPPSDKPLNGEIGWLKAVREVHMQALLSMSHPWLDKIVAKSLPGSQRAQ